MTIEISTAARNAAADAVVGLINGGSGAGVLRIYSGSRPASPGTSPSGTKLAEITLSDPAFASASNGSAAVDTTPALTTTALASGTAGWFRFCDSTEAAGTGLGVVDGDITGSGGGGDITLNTTSIVSGADVTITSFSYTQPAGG